MDPLRGHPQRGDSQIRPLLLMLSLSVIAGSVFALALRGFQGGFYIPILMPFFIGSGLASLCFAAGQKLGSATQRDVLLAAIAGISVAFVGYQVLAYLGAMERLESAFGEDPTSVLKRFTGEDGISGYFAWLAQPEPTGQGGAQGAGWAVSPIGILNQFITSTIAIQVLILVDFAVTLAAGIWMVKRRFSGAHPQSSHEAPEGPSSGHSDLLAQVSDVELLEALKAIDASDFEAAGNHLGVVDSPGEFLVLVHFPSDTEAEHILEVRVASTNAVKARRGLSADAAWALTDATRMAIAKRRYQVDS